MSLHTRIEKHEAQRPYPEYLTIRGVRFNLTHLDRVVQAKRNQALYTETTIKPERPIR